MIPEHWEADEAKWLNPQDELDEIEFGWRTAWFFFTAECASRYTPPQFDLTVFTPWGAKHDPGRLGSA